MNVLAWDSEFFGVPIARAAADDDIEATLDTARREGIACLYLEAASARPDHVTRAVRAGANLVALRAELDRRASSPSADPLVRIAGHDDLPRLREHAAALAAASRFSADPRFAQERVSAMYERWVDRCFEHGFLVVPPDASGFVGVRAEDGVAHVDLVYVDPAGTGRGIGRRLVTGALAHARTDSARVVTDVANIAALRLYESLGFRVRSVTAVLHAWLDR